MGAPTLDELQKSSFFMKSDFVPGFSEGIQSLDEWHWLSERYDQFTRISSRGGSQIIPRKIHQIWIGSKLPASYRTWTDSWVLKNQGWDYILWDKKAILNFGLVNEEAFIHSPSLGVKSDIARYEILERFGGVYADTDFECIRSMNTIAERSTFFAGVIFGMGPVINNGLIGSIPGHPVLKAAIQGLSIPVKTKDGMEVLNHSGPGYFSHIVFGNRNLLVPSDIILPSSYFYPIPNFVARERSSSIRTNDKIREWSYAIHYWEASWLKPPWWKKALSRCKRVLLSVLGRSQLL